MDLSEEDEGWQRAGDAVNHTHHPLKWCWCLSRCDLGACCEPACLSTDLTTKRSCKRLHDSTHDDSSTVFAFTFMHLAVLFSKATCIAFRVCVLLIHAFPGNQTYTPLFELQEICLQHLFTDSFAFSFLFYLHVFLYRSLLSFCYGHFNVF